MWINKQGLNYSNNYRRQEISTTGMAYQTWTKGTNKHGFNSCNSTRRPNQHHREGLSNQDQGDKETGI